MWPTLITLWLALSGNTPQRPPPRRRPAFRRPSSPPPRLEALEDRRVPSAGALDLTFGNGGTVTTSLGSDDDGGGQIFALPNGKVLVAGATDLGTNDSNEVLALLRYNADGTLDGTYQNGAKAGAPPIFGPSNGVAVGPEGQVAILQGAALWQFNPDGSPDTAFGGGSVTTDGTIGTIAFDGDKIVGLGSQRDPQTGFAVLILERYNADGTLDTSFGSGGKVISDLGLPSSGNGAQTVSGPTVQPNGAIVIGGETSADFTQEDPTVPFLARFTPTGSFDPSFGPDHSGKEVIYPDVSVLAQRPPVPSYVVTDTELTLTRTRSDFYAESPGPTAYAALTPDGKILTLLASGSDVLTQFNSDGSVDTAYLTSAPQANILSPNISIQGDGKAVLWGIVFDPVSGNPHWSALRYNADGSPDLGFGPNGDATAEIAAYNGNTFLSDLAVDSNGNIVAVGSTYDATKNGGIGGWDITLTRLIGNVLSQSGMQTALDSQPPVDPVTGNPTVTLQTSTQTQANAFLALFQNPSTSGFTPLSPPADATTPLDIVVTLGSGISVNEAALVIPQGIRVQINGGTWYGGSPALTLSSGDVTITGATFINSTNAPTILVTGGHLTLRNDVIQESTGYSQAAISVTGGTVDLGTATDPGGNTINVNGAGAFAVNTTSNPITAVGDAFTVNGLPLAPSSLSGIVWEDFNDDGQVDFGEKGISGVKITLTGTDDLGNAVNLSQLTDSDGAYVFPNLRPGNYYITETQPAGYLQGIDSVGTAGGSLAASDQFFVALGIGVNGLNYNFGEQPPAGGTIQHGQTAGIGFWNNKNGQALIKSLNGGTGTQLADWLAATLPNTFGKNAGGNNLAGKNNAYVAALFQQDFVMKGVKLDAQLLATALSVYATNATLDPTKVAASYGFTVSGDGAGTATANVGSNGDAFGVANNTTLTLMDLLLAADAQAVNGVLYNGDATRRNEANIVFSAVNQAGDIG